MKKKSEIKNREAALAWAWAGGNWLMTPRPLLAIMSADEALLLAFLLNHARVCHAYEREDGWFYCHHRYATQQLFFNEDKLTRLYAKLIKRGFIKTQIRGGMPSQRWIQIQVTYVMRLAKSKVDLISTRPSDAPYPT